MIFYGNLAWRVESYDCAAIGKCNINEVKKKKKKKIRSLIVLISH